MEGDHPVSRRVLAVCLAWRLDQELADGADPAQRSLLACRAEQLLSWRGRRRLAENIRDAVRRATRPRRPEASIPLARDSVRANRGRLLELAARLASDVPIAVIGAASANLLLGDGNSPLYAPGTPLALEDAVEATLIELAKVSAI